MNYNGHLIAFEKPIVMAIINVTPDSFYADSRVDNNSLTEVISQALSNGATLLDIGGCSTRPDSVPIDEEQEWSRLDSALEKIKNVFPSAILSIDTFRPQIIEKIVEKYGAVFINDISGGSNEMYEVAAKTNCPYILTFNEEFQELQEMVAFFQKRINMLHQIGVKDIILDPGFGFHKTLEQNYLIMHNLEVLQIFGLPILVGISRKSMICKPLQISPNEALSGTIALNTIALMKGANILRVHDVKEASDTIQIYSLLKE